MSNLGSGPLPIVLPLEGGENCALYFDGEIAESGEIPAGQLGTSLQGWDRFFQLAMYSHESAQLTLPKSGTELRVELRVRRVSKGSFLVTFVLWIGDKALDGIIGAKAEKVLDRVWRWGCGLFQTQLKAKEKGRTLDASVDAIEAFARAQNVSPSRNRRDSEDFVSALNAAMGNATAPLDSAAGRELLQLKGHDLVIGADQAVRAVIRAPFAPPEIDPDAEPVIEARVRFFRINKNTGNGSFEFTDPQDQS